jgi:uncharacterized phage protein (TIGR01671 family)
MPHQLKFRVWDSNQKRIWYVGERNGFEYYNVSLDICQSWEATRARMCYGHSRNAEDALMQWTGLKDKSGREIYEGDILRRFYYVRDNEEVNIGVVKQFQPWCGFNFEHTKNERDSGTLDQFRNGIGTDGRVASLEVIGNIYENPNLLSS